MKLGVLGGTFDPIHLGHLRIAQEAQALLGLERVLFIPTGEPWLRQEAPVASGRHRLAMTRQAVAETPAFEASTLEIDRPGPTYTVETLEALHRQQEAALDIFFVVGADALEEFQRWREPRRILELCTLVAVTRPGHPAPAPENLEALFQGAGRRLRLLPGLQIDIRGVEIRRRVAQGRPIHDWVPRRVEEYIVEHGLYQTGGA